MNNILERQDTVMPFIIKDISDLFTLSEVLIIIDDLVKNGYERAVFSLKNNDIVTDSRELAVVLNSI